LGRKIDGDIIEYEILAERFAKILDLKERAHGYH